MRIKVQKKQKDSFENKKQLMHHCPNCGKESSEFFSICLWCGWLLFTM
ncbi:MAG: hypothetical protein WCW17_02185 [Patescibacteria group bacterium]